MNHWFCWDKILLTIWESWNTLCWTWTCQSGFERGSVWCETVDGWVLFWDEREMRPRLEWALSDSFNKYQAVTPSIISPAWPGWQVASKYWSWVWGYSGTRLSGRDINLILGGAITPSMGITLLPRYNAQIIRDKGGAGIFDTRATPARASTLHAVTPPRLRLLLNTNDPDHLSEHLAWYSWSSQHNITISMTLKAFFKAQKDLFKINLNAWKKEFVAKAIALWYCNVIMLTGRCVVMIVLLSRYNNVSPGHEPSNDMARAILLQTIYMLSYNNHRVHCDIALC